MRRRGGALLLLALLSALLLEGLAWTRGPLLDLTHRSYPAVALNRSGDVVYYDVGTWGTRILDPDRRVIGIQQAPLDPELGGGPWRGRARLPLRFDKPGFLRDEDEFWFPWVGWMTSAPLESFAVSLNYEEAKRRGIDSSYVPDHGLRYVRVLRPSPVEWSAEDGRLVCRETASRRRLATLGPDGLVEGEGAPPGERFGRLGSTPARPFTAWPPDDSGDSQGPTWVWFDADGQRLVSVSLVPRPKRSELSRDSIEHLVPKVDVRPLVPFAGDATAGTRPWAARAADRLLIFFEDGSVFGDVTLERGERLVLVRGAAVLSAEEDLLVVPPDRVVPVGQVTVAVVTDFAPVHPEGLRQRLRLVRPGQPVVERDVVLEPARTSEILLANLGAAFSLLRPGPLSVVSAASPLPSDWTEVYLAWWRDPWLAGGRYRGWLLASFALAALCAWRARRTARERCATVRDVRLWTAAVFLLGPVGLLWMRFVLPRVPVEAVGEARRAVNLDASPSTTAPWPDPKPLGIEVIS